MLSFYVIIFWCYHIMLSFCVIIFGWSHYCYHLCHHFVLSFFVIISPLFYFCWKHDTLDDTRPWAGKNPPDRRVSSRAYAAQQYCGSGKLTKYVNVKIFCKNSLEIVLLHQFWKMKSEVCALLYQQSSCGVTRNCVPAVDVGFIKIYTRALFVCSLYVDRRNADRKKRIEQIVEGWKMFRQQHAVKGNQTELASLNIILHLLHQWRIH